MQIQNQIVIHAKPASVFYWLEKPERAKKWQQEVTATVITQQTPNNVGTTFVETIQEGNKSTCMAGLVTEFSRDKKLAIRLHSAQLSLHIVFELEAVEDATDAAATKVTQTASIQFKGIMRFMALLLRPLFEKRIRENGTRDLMALKKVCEKSSTALPKSQ